MVILVVIVLRNFKRKQKDYKIISEQKEEIRIKNERLELRNKEVTAQNEQINLQKIKLEEQAKKLHELDEIKSRFFTNISHEFRTPLTLIIGPLEQLLVSVNDSKVLQSLKLMLRNAKNLLELINQLLEISKIEKGNVKLRFQKGNISDELKYIFEMFSSFASEKNIKLTFTHDHFDYTGYIDKEKFNKIIINLLSNAFKHTQKGSINAELAKSENQGFVKVKIMDSGIGIHKEKLPFIFDRFYQADNNETEGTAGTGIGLSYIKELIHLYKGSISAESVVGKGSTFVVEIPVVLDFYSEDEYELVATEKPEQADIHIESEGDGFENKDEKAAVKHETILIVEDHADLRRFLAENLSDTYRIFEAKNGEEGIQKAMSELPDMVITDIMMPKVNGIELTKTLKTTEATSHIPIVMLTAKGSLESKIEGLECEADDYLTKPFNIEELKVRIKNIIKTRKKLQEKYNKSIVVNPSEITTTSVDEKFLSKLLKTVEDNMADSDFSVEMLCELVGMSRANIHKKLKHLVNQSATEFINSIRLKRAAQLIKQNAGNISEIAYDVGFNNLSYFSRAFKNHFGITPTEMMENT